MKNAIQISIPTPCNENWQEMTVVDIGKFCSSCQKTVIDFTNISDREIINIFNKSNNLCGRFNENQLNRTIVAPKEKSSLWIAASAAVVSFFTIGNHESIAQGEPKTVQTDKRINEKTTSLGNVEIVVSGKILSDAQEYIPQTIYIKNLTTKEEITSNDGFFSVKLNKVEKIYFYTKEDDIDSKVITFKENNDNYTVLFRKISNT